MLLKTNIEGMYTADHDTNDQNDSPKPRRKRGCCCSGCLVMLVLFALFILGLGIWLFVQSRPRTSEVEKEYRNIPEYFDENSHT